VREPGKHGRTFEAQTRRCGHGPYQVASGTPLAQPSGLGIFHSAPCALVRLRRRRADEMSEPGEVFRDAPRHGACNACGRRETVEVDTGGLCLDCRQIKNTFLFGQQNACRGCGKILEWKHLRFADMCPCNSARGVNHGLVPPKTCTCIECDPAQTGSTRYDPLPPKPDDATSIWLEGIDSW